MAEFDDEGNGGYHEKDEHLEHMKEMRRELRLSLGFRIRVTRDELKTHLLKRAAYHEAERLRILELLRGEKLDRRTVEFAQASKSLFFHKSTAEAYAFYATHMTSPFFDLPPEDCLKLELCAPAMHDSELFPGFKFHDQNPFAEFASVE